MRPLLVLNPNTSEDVTRALLERAHARGDAGVHWLGCTAAFGARYISGEVAAALAAHAALEAYAAHAAEHGEPAAALLACFGDPGLFALRALARVPVLGLAEVSMRAAAQQGPFVVVTGGARWEPMLWRLARALELDAALCGITTVEASGSELAADPARAEATLRVACATALERWPQARSLLLGGAALGGMARAVGDGLHVPVLDSVDLALGALRDAALAADTAAASTERPSTEPGPWSGLSPTLAARLVSGP